jgi:ABC-type nitrate/sulfonate/bicarbonate transport system permease component
MTRPVPSASDKLAESADGTVGMGGTLGLDSTIDIATAPKEKYWVDLGLRSLSIIGFFALWYAASFINVHVWRVFNPALLPSPGDVLEAAIQLTYSGELPRDVAASLGRVIMGFLIAAFLGVSMGTLIGRSRNIERLLEPALELLRPIPPLAFLPVFVLWFGIGESSKVAFITYSAFFPIFTTTTDGIKFVDILLIRAAQTLGASEREIFRMVVLPAAMPSIITGLRVGFAQCLFVIVAAEFIAADSGLGYLINDSRSFFLMSNMLVGAAAIGVLGFIFNSLLRRLESRLLRWREDARGPG